MALVALAGGTSISEAAISAGPGRWTISYTNRLPMSSFLAAVAVSPRDIWAIGKFATSAGPNRAIIRRWDGRAWRTVDLPRQYRGLVPSDIAGTSPDNIWVSGWVFGDFESVALRWNGHHWSRVTGLPKGIAGRLMMAVTGPKDAWIFDGSGNWHYNGRRWRRFNLPYSVFGVSAVSANNIWAIGEGPNRPVLARWHDGRWTTHRLPFINRYAALFNVLALPDGELWITGGTLGTPEIPLALHYQNGEWRRYQGPGGDFLGPAVPDGTGGIWAAHLTADDLTTMVHIDARGWHEVKLPGVRGKHTSVTTLAKAPRSRTVFAFGELFWSSMPYQTDGLILRTSP